MDTTIEWRQVFDAPPVWKYDAQEASHGDDIHAVIQAEGDEYKWHIGFLSDGYARMIGSAPTQDIAMRDCSDRIAYLRQEARKNRARHMFVNHKGGIRMPPPDFTPILPPEEPS